jgi:uncharacterized protein (DUF488 family)
VNAAPRTIATIGVYCFDAVTFIERLRGAGIRLLVDVRQRRGVRGSQFAWANSQRLQALLAQESIGYSHHLELAPTTELRQLQYREDDRNRVGKRYRERLAPEYAGRYTREILDRAPLEPLVDELQEAGPGVLLCVECLPGACHRSLVAERLASRFGFAVSHLLPRDS